MSLDKADETPRHEVTAADIRRYTDRGYSHREALALTGIRLVGESAEEWQLRTSRIIQNREGLGDLLESMERLA